MNGIDTPGADRASGIPDTSPLTRKGRHEGAQRGPRTEPLADHLAGCPPAHRGDAAGRLGEDAALRALARAPGSSPQLHASSRLAPVPKSTGRARASRGESPLAGA
ncbi:hypothetical protein SAT01_04990 [Sinomonas atrocyanea]|nr:hypothetical protein SAT01_04990 [Sinomonas atrocyanea]GGG72751.1 hypothetical protein GCM10007172_26590 [Sinomonas atrocyanea]